MKAQLAAAKTPAFGATPLRLPRFLERDYVIDLLAALAHLRVLSKLVVNPILLN